jgi:hypothetical protein
LTIVPDTQEAKIGGLLEARNSGVVWAIKEDYIIQKKAGV